MGCAARNPLPADERSTAAPAILQRSTRTRYADFEARL
jgi:hypothetical protein